MKTSHVIRHERCPECAKLGRDNTHDNLAVYSDGHSWCYSCHYSTYPSGIERFKGTIANTVLEKEPLTLPVDCDINYPSRALKWIEQYELTRVDLLNNNVMWSESMQRLIFPVYADGWLLAWQGRYFGTQSSAVAKIAKWYGKGNLKGTLHILGKGTSLVLVEDVVSAMKVAKCGVRAMPLFGCVVGDRFKWLKTVLQPSDRCLIWLDPDKHTESIKEAKLGVLYGLNCSPVFSEVDPKELEYSEIERVLNETI